MIEVGKKIVVSMMPSAERTHILVVEDDGDTAEVVAGLLENSGYSVTTSSNGTEALKEIDKGETDLVLLDIDLPDTNGIDVLQQARRNTHMPMIMLSGYGKEMDRVRSLESGADDYIAKPFIADELLARIRALLRRVKWAPATSTRLQVRELVLDLPRRQISIQGQHLLLTPIEYGILVILMKHAGRVVSHRELMNSVWGEHFSDDYSVLRVNISRLRSKLEVDPRQPRLHPHRGR